MSLDNLDKIIIKIGSSLIINEENAINDLFLDEISKDILSLEKRGIKTLIVSSGAIELGKIDLNKSKNKLNFIKPSCLIYRANKTYKCLENCFKKIWS